MRLCMIPFEIKSNQYIELMKKSYEKCGISVVEVPSSSEVISLNWFENIDSKYAFKRLFIYIKKNIQLFLWRNKIIIWTMHNKQPHDSSKKFLSNRLIKTIIKKSDKIIIHSKESVNELYQSYNLKSSENIVYVPHPNYINQYGKYNMRRELNNKQLKLLFVGAIKEYKNIELLIKVINELNNENIQLSICGKVSDSEYKARIEKLVNNNLHIQTNFNFIEDKKLPSFLDEHHILVTPYNVKSSLNSGTIILSFSYGRTVLSPNIGTLNDIREEKLFFSYDYDTYDEHYNRLKEEILFIYEKYSGRYDDLLEVGQQCYDYIEENNSIEKTAEALMSILV